MGRRFGAVNAMSCKDVLRGLCSGAFRSLGDVRVMRSFPRSSSCVSFSAGRRIFGFLPASFFVRPPSCRLRPPLCPARLHRLFRTLGCVATAFVLSQQSAFAQSAVAEIIATTQADDFRAIASGVFARPGKAALASPDNAGVVGASLVVCLGDRILWIDPGPTASIGSALSPVIRRLCAHIAQSDRSDALPLDLAVTRASPELSLAASGITHRWFYATPAVAQAMAERCPKCLEQLTETLGAQAMAATRIVVPEKPVTDQQAVRPAPDATATPLPGPQWLAPVARSGHAAFELAVADRHAGWLYAPTLVFAHSWPRLAEMDLDLWIATLEHWLSQGWRTVIAADAIVTGPAAIAQTLEDLRRLRVAIDADLRAGGDVATMDRRLVFADQQHRPLFAQRHSRLIQGLARQRELKMFDE